MQDASYSVRTLAKTPGFTAVAALVLASRNRRKHGGFHKVVNGVLLRPLPYPEPERLFLISNLPKDLIFNPGPIMVDSDYLEFRRYNHSFESLATVANSEGSKISPDEAWRSRGTECFECLDRISCECCEFSRRWADFCRKDKRIGTPFC